MSEAPELRSRIMRAVHSRDTAPEMAVRRFLHAKGLRYQLHDSKLPGKPDLVFPGKRVVIFVNGCFWHQHEGCRRSIIPQSNKDYWNDKLRKNKARDESNYKKLVAMGWQVLVVWECEVRNKKYLDQLLVKLVSI